MPTNKKPVLSVLVDGEKRDQFARLCQKNGRPMAWAINAFISQCLEQDSIDLKPISSPSEVQKLTELQEMVAGLKQDLSQLLVQPKALSEPAAMVLILEESSALSPPVETVEKVPRVSEESQSPEDKRKAAIEEG